MKYINNKSPGSQEDIECALCWKQKPVVLIPLKSGKDDKMENNMKLKEKPSTCPPF
jgi:hypothetical protein